MTINDDSLRFRVAIATLMTPSVGGSEFAETIIPAEICPLFPSITHTSILPLLVFVGYNLSEHA
jgi:hypothetical protein